jgi:signal transduction histidine kinase
MASELSNRLHRELLDTIDSGVAVYEVTGDGTRGEDYVVLDFNRFALEHEGKTREQVVGRTLVELRPNIDDFGLIQVFREVWTSGEPQFFPAKVYADDDFSHWYENRVFRLDANRIVAVYTDVTEHKGAQLALAESESLLREVLDTMQVAIAIYEAVDDGDDFVFVDMNEFAEGITHYKVSEVIGKRITELFPEEASMGLIDTLNQVWRSGETATIPLKQYADDRITQWVENTIFKLRSGRVVAMFEDTFEQRMAETALRQSEERYRLAQRIGHVGNWEYDIQTDVLWGSEEALRLVGVDPESGPVTRQEVQDGLVDGDRIAEAVANLIQHEAPFDVEFESVPAGSSELRTVTSVAGLVRSSDGTPIKLSGTVHDVTETRRQQRKIRDLEHQALQSQKLETVGRLAGGIAHDFNNLLTVISSYAEFLAADLGEKDPRREDVQEIQAASKRAAELTGQLLAFSRKQVLNPSVVDMNEVVTGVQRMLGRLLGEDVDLRASLLDDLGLVHVDQGQLEQVLMNLVVNGREAMPQGGTLTIATRNVTIDDASGLEHPAGETTGQMVMLSVTDTGVGMHESVRDRVFEPFFTTKGKDQGTGLGLSTAYGIVRQSGGDIRVITEGGHGTTIEVLLPRVYAEKTAAARVDETTVLQGTEVVLVVEDETPVRHLTRRILDSAGYEVITAANGLEALGMVERRGDDIDLVLTDVVMPEMGGQELARRLSQRWPRLHIVFMSGYTDDAIANHGVLADDVNFIGKPFVPPVLLSKIRSVLDDE